MTDFWAEQYDLTGNNAYSWWSAAERLFSGSKYLCLHSAYHTLDSDEILSLVKSDQGLLPPEPLRIGGVIMMLRGMGIECLLKALWVDNGRELAADGKYQKIPGSTEHNLMSLSDKVGAVVKLDLTADDRYVMERLSVYIVTGRYPIPRNWEVTKPKSLPRGVFGSITNWEFPTDERTYNQMVEKLTSKLSFYASIVSHR